MSSLIVNLEDIFSPSKDVSMARREKKKRLRAQTNPSEKTIKKGEATSCKINKCVCVRVSTTDWVVIANDICKNEWILFGRGGGGVWKELTWVLAMLELDLYTTAWRLSIGRCWLERSDVSQEEVTWWWCLASVRTPGEVERIRTAVGFDEWSHAGILKRLAGCERVKEFSEWILFVGRLYRWV